MIIDWTQIINEILNSDKSIKMHHIAERIGVHRTTVVNCRTRNSALRYETGVRLVNMWREKADKLDADPPQIKSSQTNHIKNQKSKIKK